MHSIAKFQPDQVVFLDNSDQVKSKLTPAKIIKMSSYGTYKIKVYGSKFEEYVSEYALQPCTEEKLQEALDAQGKGVKNKKVIKFLKTAQKDHHQYLEKKKKRDLGNEEPEADDQLNRICKEEESEDSEAENQEKRKNCEDKSYAIEQLKVEDLLRDFHISGETSYSFQSGNQIISCRDKSKFLLFLKLEWALSDIVIESQFPQEEFNFGNIENVITKIIESDVVEPIDFVTTPIFSKLKEAVEGLKKMKKTKMRNYLLQRQEIILQGVQNYLENYTVFLNIEKRYKAEFLRSDVS